MRLLRAAFYIPRAVILLFIRVYQLLLSPDHSIWSKVVYPHGFCRFHPSCSVYAYYSIKEQGLLFGGARAVYRILRCNPWNKGGLDYPPGYENN